MAEKWERGQRGVEARGERPEQESGRKCNAVVRSAAEGFDNTKFSERFNWSISSNCICISFITYRYDNTCICFLMVVLYLMLPKRYVSSCRDVEYDGSGHATYGHEGNDAKREQNFGQDPNTQVRSCSEWCWALVCRIRSQRVARFRKRLGNR